MGSRFLATILLLLLLGGMATSAVLLRQKNQQVALQRKQLEAERQRLRSQLEARELAFEALTQAVVEHTTQCPADCQPLLEASLGVQGDLRTTAAPHAGLNVQNARLHAQLGRLQTARDPQQAVRELSASLSIYQLLLDNSLPGEALELEHGRTLLLLGLAQNALGEKEAAREALRASLTAARAYNERASDALGRGWLVDCLEALAGVCADAGDADSAARLAAEAAALEAAEAE